MCHLFLEKNSLPVRDGGGQLRDNFSPIGLARSDYFIRDGMLFASCTEVISIKRFVDDKSVSPITPRAHHGGRDISRARPHGDSDRLNHRQRIPRSWTNCQLELILSTCSEPLESATSLFAKMPNSGRPNG